LLQIVADNLAFCMETLNLNAAQVAERSGVSLARVYLVLKGRQNITLETLAKLAAAVGQAVSQMVTDHRPRGSRR
jgi:transcriptional regulator with XRE-family HTH domain